MGETRTSVVAVIGAPNAGKSTLVNRLVGAKISIVTHKVQTTRFRVRGVATRGEVQLILVDTPGVFAPKRRFDRAMVRAAWAGADDADDIVVVVDAAAEDARLRGEAKGADRLACEDNDRILKRLDDAGLKPILALNKLDTMPRERTLAVIEALRARIDPEKVFVISAARGDGVEDLHAALEARARPGPWLYPDDQSGDLPMRLLAAEVTRERAFLRLHEELPYEMTVEPEAWEEKADGSVRIEQTLYVSRASHKPIALGKNGRTIKEIGAQAREQLEAMMDRRVHLFLFVKVREKWMDDRARYEALGLDFGD